MFTEKKLLKFISAIEIAKKELVKIYEKPNDIDLQSALMDCLQLDDPFELLEKDLTPGKIVTLLKNFEFYTPELLEQIFLEDTIIPDNVFRLLYEEELKHNGEIWLIHKYDRDPFPSNPHAHNKESGLKLHLGNGELYFKRKLVGKIKRKDLLTIRSLTKAIKLPELLI